jgi:hypothetical protein
MLAHESAYLVDNNQTYKIGSSKALPQRLLSYKTYYPIDKKVIGYFYIENYDCYNLDNDIKLYFDIDTCGNNIRIKLNGGIEFYQNITIEDLKKYFISRSINFVFYDDDDYLQSKYIHNNLLNNNHLIEFQLNVKNALKNDLLNQLYNKLYPWSLLA